MKPAARKVYYFSQLIIDYSNPMVSGSLQIIFIF